MKYVDKLKNPRWQKKRLEIFQRDNFTCQSCGSTEKTLHIHHLKYLPGKQPWEYENWFLITYCDICHESEHLIGDVTRESLFELIEANKIYFKPLAQLCILIEEYKPFYMRLKAFLNEMMIENLKSKTLKITDAA